MWARQIIFAWLLFTHAASAAPLPRVMSLNLCADPYLMGFAAPAQVVALTPQSRDADLSAFTATAQNFPISDGRIETIAALKPDLIIVSSYSDPLRNQMVARLGIEVLTLDAANNYATARREILKLGGAIGRTQQAEAYLARLDSDLAQAQNSKPKAAKRPQILPLQRRNLTAGEGHIVDEIINLAGGANMARQSIKGVMGRISLEAALAARADYILLNETAKAPDSRGMEFLTHPALAQAYPPKRRLTLNNNLLVCAGASTPLAVARLIAQLASD